MKTVREWHNDRNKDRWDRRDSAEINLYLCGQLTATRILRKFKGEIVFLSKCAVTTQYLYAME